MHWFKYSGTLLVHRPQLGFRLLSAVVAGLFLLHGLAKVQHGLGWVEDALPTFGLPGFLAYGAYLGEVVAPLLVISGFFVAPAALVMAANMVMAIALAHGAQLFSLNPQTGGYALELQALYLAGSLAIAFMAPGRGYKLTGATHA